MTIKIFADGSSIEKIREQARDPNIAGFTTNPSLARAAGVQNYRAFAEEVLAVAGDKSVSLEVLSDDFVGMEREAHIIAALGKNAVVKVPVVNSIGESSMPLIARLCDDGVAVNVTAVFTPRRVDWLCQQLSNRRVKLIVSVFAGRIADAGVDPCQVVSKCRRVLHSYNAGAELLWASARQVYDVVLAENVGCDIITLSPDLIAKLPLRGKDLEEYSRETAAQFHRDAQAAGFEL